MQILERADVDVIDFGGYDGTVTKVRGYQNYSITDTQIEAINNPTNKRPWTDTKIKSSFFEEIFHKLTPSSYADFGSNLGYYVFYSALHKIPSLGIDYNPEYIGICNSIQIRHNVSFAKFLAGNLENWAVESDTYDFMTVFNVIHHLYNRTERYMDMNKLVGDFAKKAKNVLFEFPTENDKKGYKWTMDTNYCEELFVNSLMNIFATVKKIEGQTEHRPYYLCINSKLLG